MAGVSDFDKQQRQLEDDLSKLQNALKHWQTWHVEYEMLKEEVEAVCKDGETELKTIHAGFEGELLKDRELDEIFGERTHRSGEQILNILDRRIDYVTTNITSLRFKMPFRRPVSTISMMTTQPQKPRALNKRKQSIPKKVLPSIQSLNPRL